MSAQKIYDTAPLGALIRYSDGTPRPPDRFERKLVAWQGTNGMGRLIQKQPGRQIGSFSMPATIKLHQGDLVSEGVIRVVIRQTFFVTDRHTFEVVETPPIGSVRVLDIRDLGQELLHIAADRSAAEAWLRTKRYPDAIIDEVTADEEAARVVEGRAA
jgi:hypothetical protein